MGKSKIFTLEQADAWVSEQRAAGRRIGFTCGSFDLLHAGHVQYLEQARAECDALLVAVNSDASIRRYKSPLRPIQELEHRQYLLAALECVDAVTVLEQDRPLELIVRWKPDLYIKGGDYAPEKLRSAATVADYGGRTVVIPPRYPTSTSRILERIRTIEAHAVPDQQTADGRPVVFLDRDGTLIDNVPFLHEPERIRFRPGVLEGLGALQRAGFRLAVVTNQQGLGLGYFGMDELIAVNQRMLREIGAAGVTVEKIYFCPHSMAQNCNCRKPKPGMVLRGLAELGAAAGASFLIGDHDVDLEAAAAAGVRGVRVEEGENAFGRAVEEILGAARG